MKNTFKSTKISNITTLISKATEISGDVHFSGTLEVEGKVNGNIYADDDSSAQVRIRESGLVRGEIQAPLVIINGLVEGDVYSSNHLELAAKARVTGNVYYHLIEMVMGSEVNGSLCHKSSSELLPKQLSVQRNEAAANGDEPASSQASGSDEALNDGASGPRTEKVETIILD